jgi:hypothetical protein
MISHVMIHGPWLKGSSGMNLPYVPTLLDNPMQGVIRINSYGQLELYNSGYWQGFSQNTVYVDTTMSTNAILEWAERKMMEEQRYAKLAEQSTAVADALEAVHTAEEQLRVVVSLTQENK